MNFRMFPKGTNLLGKNEKIRCEFLNFVKLIKAEIIRNWMITLR